MSTWNLGGIEAPKVMLDVGTIILLPEPNGSGRDGIEVYDFVPESLNEYRSEGNLLIEVGKMFTFNASLQWISASKVVLLDVFKMAAEKSFLYWLHRDDDTVKYRVKVSGKIDHKYFAGAKNHPGGYTIRLNLVGVEYVAAPFEGSLESGAGFGTDWGVNAQNQSP